MTFPCPPGRSNTTLLVIVLIAVAVVAVLLVAFFVFRRQRGEREQQERQERARQEYGSEYERLVEERGSEQEAEQELRERRERVEGDVRPLSEESLRGYEERWQRVEQTFVDDPGSALDEADRVVGEILVERNFPTDSRQEASEGSVSCTQGLSRSSGRPSEHTGTPPAPKGGGPGGDAPGDPEIPLGIRAPNGKVIACITWSGSGCSSRRTSKTWRIGRTCT